MDISSNTAFTSQPASNGSAINGSAVNNVGQSQNTNRTDNDVRRDRVQNIQPEQEQAQQTQNSSREQRFEANEETLALIEEQYQASQEQNNTQVLTRQGAIESNTSGNNNSQSNTFYDQPTQQNNTAISAYQGVDGISQRESIEQQFGVDLYA